MAHYEMYFCFPKSAYETNTPTEIKDKLKLVESVNEDTGEITYKSSITWKDAVFSEIDYSFNDARKALKLGASDARGYMIRNNEWKYIYFKGFPPQLFDLKNDPEEFKDLGQLKDHSKVRNEMRELLLKKLVSRKNRVAASDEFVLKDRNYTKEDDIMIGVW